MDFDNQSDKNDGAVSSKPAKIKNNWKMIANFMFKEDSWKHLNQDFYEELDELKKYVQMSIHHLKTFIIDCSLNKMMTQPRYGYTKITIFT